MTQLTKTKIRNGMVELPATISKQWRNKEVLVLPEEGRIIIQEIRKKPDKQTLLAWKKAAGILKHKGPDPVKWQRKIRKEWERKII